MVILLAEDNGYFAYIFPDDCTETANPQYTLARNLVHKQSLATKHGLTESLALVLLCDALGRREEGIFADVPDVGAIEAEEGDVAQGGGSEEDLARASVV